jgi:ornithine decarboxylase
MAPSLLTPDDVYVFNNYHPHTKDPDRNIVTHLDIQHGVNDALVLRGHSSPKEMILGELKKRVDRIDIAGCEPGEEDAFYVADMGEVYRQHMRWKMNLGRVKPFYAVKCNPDPEVLRLMAKLGNGFDCASKTEIDLALKTGIDPSRIIYAQPCKTRSYLRYARQKGVKQMTFDNADELYKIKNDFPDAELYLRILTDDSTSLCRLSMKFGASLDTARPLLDLAKKLELNVVGVSFHVGSGAEDPGAFLKAAQDARWVFDQAAEVGYELHTLDVGGGFCDETFEKFAAILSKAVDDLFPANIRVIAEPGRYYVAAAFTLAANVIARRDVFDPQTSLGSYMIYLNDGVYGNFSNIIFDHQHPIAQILTCANGSVPPTPGLTASGSSTPDPSAGDSPCAPAGVEYSIWGPTCDGIDVISQQIVLPGLVDVGDWLYFEDMGAYTRCSATRLNGFPDNHDVIYVSSESGASALLEY